LLDAAADLVDDLRPEADDMKGVEHRDRVPELVPDRVRIATGTDQERLVRRRR
jgi:hypothetical protein